MGHVWLSTHFKGGCLEHGRCESEDLGVHIFFLNPNNTPQIAGVCESLN